MARWRSSMVAVVALLGVVAAARPVGAQPLVYATPALSQTPAYPSDFPDPDVVATTGGYVAYATGTAGTNLQVMTSADLRTWTTPSDPLPVLPTWAVRGRTWAPGVVHLGGKWIMYYTARDAARGVQCIGVATASMPTGPFSDRSSQPTICQSPGSIDPSPFVTGDGVPYLLWKSDDNSTPGVATRLWSQRLTSDGLALRGSPALLLTADAAWQGGVIEGPTMVRDGLFDLLFYGGNRWDTAGSAIGFAVCLSPIGPCLDTSLLSPWLATSARIVGPQGPSFFTDGAGGTHLAYATWTGAVGYAGGGRRSLWIDRVSFPVGLPVLGG